MNRVDIETLWDTYDFALLNITKLEDEVAFFVSHVDKKAALVEAGVLTEDQFLKFCEEALQHHKNLISFYDKQLHTLKDIIKIKPKEQPPEREVALESLNELRNLTTTLKMVIEEAKLGLTQMISELKES